MGKKCVAWVLALVLALCGCSAGGGNSVPAGESAHASAVEAAAQPTASPAPEPAPATVEGEVARASKSAFELRLEDGSVPVSYTHLDVYKRQAVDLRKIREIIISKF